MLHTPDPCGVNNATTVLILRVREPDQEQQELLEDKSSCLREFESRHNTQLSFVSVQPKVPKLHGTPLFYPIPR